MRSATWITLLLLASAWAGCLGDDEIAQQSLPDTSTPPSVDEIERRVVTVLEDGMGEPSLGVTPEGVLFTNGGEGAYRSTDGGQSWEHLGEPTAPAPNFDPDLAVDTDGTVWFDVLTLACNSVSVSQDGGETWTTNHAACPAPGGDRQYVIPTEDGEAFLYYHQLPTFQHMAVRTTDHGQTWAPTGPVESPDHHLLVNEGSGWGGGGFWNEATDSVFLTFSWFNDGPAGEGGWTPAFAVTRDDLTWEVQEVAEAQGDPLGLSLVVGAADDAGNVYLAWGEDRHGDVGIFYAASTDDGQTWSEPVRVDDGTGSKVFPAITAGADGRVAIAYYEADEDGHPNEVSEEAAWNVTLATVTEAATDTPGIERARLSPQVVRHGPICPSGTSCTEDREFLDYFALETMPDGRVASVYNSLERSEDELSNVFTETQEPLLGAP